MVTCRRFAWPVGRGARTVGAVMRIGLVSPYSLTVPGGVQTQVLALGRTLRAMGHKVRVLGPCDGAPPEAGITPLGNSIPMAVNGSVAPIAPDPSCALRTIRALRDEQFDVVHLHEPLVPGPCETVLMLNNVTTIGTWHAAGGSIAYKVPGTRVLANRMSHRVAVSEDAHTMAKLGLGGEYTVLWNGIELARFAKADPWPADGPTVLFVGRHEPRKGLAVLLDAMQQLPDHVRLWIVGHGPETEALQASVGSDARYEWLGAIDDKEMASRLRGADVFCVPSLRGESFGVVLLEGMAASTPVVAADLPGYRNVVIDGDEAILVPPGDSAALAAGLMSALTDVKRVDSLVAAGLARADHFSMARLAARYVEIYESVSR